MALLALGLVLSLVLVEASLRAAAFFFAPDGPDPPAPSGPGSPGDAYRVLCVGESTTAPFFGVPYPTRLGAALNRRYGTRFEVINAGRPGTHSAERVARLPALLSEHHPQMVILMMGVNDHLYFDEPDRAWLPSRAQRWLYRLRTYRLLRLLRQRLAAPGPEAVDAEHLRRFEATRAEVVGDLMEGGGIELEEPLLGLIRMAREAPGGRQDAGLLDVPQPYLAAYQRAHVALAELYVDAGRADDAVALLEGAVQRHPQVRSFRAALGRILLELGEVEEAELHLREARRLARRQPLTATRESYRDALALLRQHGVRIVAMQYPMRSLAPLRELVGAAPDVVFVDNEGSFREAVERLGYDRVFRDRFAGDFGHWGEVGNRIVVENLIESVFEPLFGDQARPPRR